MTGFASTVERWAANAQRDLEATVTEVVHQVADRLIARSPVDSGLFRSNWQLGVDGPVFATLQRTDGTEVNGLGAIPQKASGHRYFITNALPYALRLEYGFNGPDSLGRVYAQPPHAMVGLVQLEFDSLVRAAAAKVKGAG